MVKYRRKDEVVEKAIAKGAIVNVLGTVGKAMMPVLFILITRMYGPAIMGLFYLVYTFIDMVVSMTVSGFNDGMVMFLSRDIDEGEEKETLLYSIVANGFVVSILISIVLISAAHLGGIELLKSKYRQPEVLDMLKYLVWSLPFVFTPILAIAATKSLMIMKWDAIILGFFRPFFLILFSTGFYFFNPTLVSLAHAYLLSAIVVALISLVVFYRYFSYRKLFQQIVHFRFYRPLITFAIPQNLNMTFNTFITNLDVVMLGYFQYSPQSIAFYAMGAQIVRNLRQVKLAFSSSYAPIIARLHVKKKYQEMNDTFSMVSRWTSVIGFPIALLIVLFRNELVQVFHPSFTSDTTFMIVLLVPPLISCTIGLSANILVMTGHSTFNMANSVLSAAINGTLNYILIPRYGLVGAAVATGISALLITLMILLEVRILEKVSLKLSQIYRPYVAILLPIALLVLGERILNISATWQRVVASLIVLAVYVGMLSLLKQKSDPSQKRLSLMEKLKSIM